MPVQIGPTEERLALAERVARLRAKGFSHAQVAVELGLSRSWASELANDPDGALSRQRKDSYGGTCLDCGKRTTGSNGSALAPERCADCEAIANHENATWNRETVIAAIQRFAAEHGRAPIADEWRRADPERGYPAASSVYDNGTKKIPVFPSWADAIEAAGFERPTSGRRIAMTQARGGYTVLQETAPGVWTEVGTYNVTAQILALNEALNGHEPEGRWVAIPGRYWEPRELRPKTIYEFVST